MKKAIAIFLVIVVLSAVVWLAFRAHAKAPSYSPMTEIGNMRNGGDVVESVDGTGYYLDIVEHGIRKLRDSTTILAAGDVSAIYLCNQDWIYYRSSDTGYLSRVSSVTGETEMVVDQQLFELVSMDGRLYGSVSLSKRLCKIEEDCVSGEIMFTYLTEAEVDTLTVVDHILYFRGDETLFCLSKDEIATVATGINIKCHSLYAINGILYYIDEQKEILYKMDKDGTCEALIPEYLPQSINVWNDCIVFVTYDDQLMYCTFMYDPNTGAVTKYADRGYNRLYVVGNSIYSIQITYDGSFLKDVKTGRVVR